MKGTAIKIIVAAMLAAFAFAFPAQAASDAKPSEEVQEMLDMFSEDDGLTAEEKIPALAAFLDEHSNEPGAGQLADLLEKFAKEANDKTALRSANKIKSEIAAKEAAEEEAKASEKLADDVVVAEDSGWKGDENLPPPSSEEAAEAAKYYERIDAEFAKLPKLPDVPTGGKMNISAPQVPCELLNSASRTAPIVVFREAVRSAIGCMTPETEKKFEREFAAALEYPSEKITEWCAKAGPIVLEMSRVKAAMMSEVAAYDETLAESALARDAGSASAAHDQLRQLGCITASLKAGQAKMEELKAQLDALGPMPDPKEEKAKDAADYKEAKRTLRMYYGPEAKIGGWYEAVGKSLSGTMNMAKKGEAPVPKEKAFEGKDFRVYIPTNNVEVWRRDKIYIRPLVGFKDKGIDFVYVNSTNPDLERLGAVNVLNGIIADDGAIEIFPVGGKEKITVTPYIDDNGKDCILVRKLSYGVFSSAMYRYVGGGDEEMLPGKDAGKTVPWADMVAGISSEKYVRSKAEDLAEAVNKFNEWLPRMPIRDVENLPLAKDVHYVLDKVTNEEMRSGFGSRWFCSKKHELQHIDDKGEYYKELKKRYGTAYFLKSGVPGNLRKYVVDTGRFKCLARRTDDIFWDIVTNKKGDERVFFSRGTGHINFMWETPSALIDLENGNYSMNVWHSINMSPPHGEMMFELGEVRFAGLSRNTHEKSIECYDSSSGKIEFKGSILDRYSKSDGLKCPPKITARLLVELGSGVAGCEFTYKRVVMPADEAVAVANMSAVRFKEDAKSEWHGSELEEKIAETDAAEKAERELAEAEEKARKEIEAAKSAAAQAEKEEKEQTIAFHKENIKFIEGTIERLEAQYAHAKSDAERKSIQWQITCEKSNIIYEKDRIRAEQTGEWQATRTPFDDMCITQVRETAAKEVEELARVDRARKFVEKFMETEDDDGKRMIVERMGSIIDSDPCNPEKWERLRKQLIFNRREELSRASAEHEAEIAAIDDSIKYLERVKTVSEIAVSVGCGGEAFGVAKGIGCIYMMTTGWIDGGFTNGLDKTARFASKIADVALSTYYGIKEEGWKGGMKSFEISVAMNYGIPFLMDKLKGPPDTTGCWNTLDADSLKTWNPKLATRKPKVADINAAYFEMKNARQQIKTYMEKKGVYQMLSDVGKDQEAILKARREMFKSVGKINENPVAKGLLKYDKKYLNNGTSLMYSLHMDEMTEIARVRTINDMTLKKGFNRQELVSFRNKSSYMTPGMDTDLGLVETKDMKILRNGKQVSKYEYAHNAQETMNEAWKEVTGGCDAQKSFINITFSGDKEAYRTLEILDASKDAQKMRELLRNASPSDVQQMFDVSNIKSLEMEAMKNHPKMVGIYESGRGWAKDLDTKYLPALEGEIAILKDTQKELTKFGKELAPSDSIKLRRLEKTYEKYKKISDVCGKVGRMEIPLYEADAAIRTITGGERLPSTIQDLSETFQMLNIQNAEKMKKLKKVKSPLW